MISKLVDQGYYEAVGRRVQLRADFREFQVDKWEPIMNQTMILAYVALSVGWTLSIISFHIEIMHGVKKPEPSGGWFRSVRSVPA